MSTEHTNSLKQWAYRSILLAATSVAAMGFSLLPCLAGSGTSSVGPTPSPVLPVAPTTAHHIYYVSRRSTAPVKTGLSWAAAFPELNAIDWKVIEPGDLIKIDGGRTAMLYQTSLVVQQSGITIESAPDPGRAGIVEIDKGTVLHNPTQSAIEIANCNNVTIRGLGWHRIRVYNYAANGGVAVEVGSNASNITLRNIAIDGLLGASGVGLTGLSIAGNGVTCDQLVIHDNDQNVGTLANLSQPPVFNRCWIYQTGAQRSGPGYGSGVTVAGTYPISPTPSGWLSFTNCVIGPGLVCGISASIPGTALALSNCLLLNASWTNIYMADPSCQFSLLNVTSFLTPLNAQNQGHYCLFMPAANFSKSQVAQSIFYGGVVNVGLTSGVLGSSNYQFKTSGNTMALGSIQEDPKFITNVAAYPNNVTTAQLDNVNLGLSASSPIPKNIGSQLPSIAKLLSANQ